MANPTAASAAATAMTKKAKSTPSMDWRKRERVTNVRLTELSINSMHMKTTIALRRVKAPITPMVKRIPLRTRYKAGGTDGMVISNLAKSQFVNGHCSMPIDHWSLIIHPYVLFLLKTTAPMIAVTRRTEMISKGKRYSVNSSSPTAFTLAVIFSGV